MTREMAELVSGKYPQVAAEILSPILELLRLSREHCRGDLDKFIVILVVALRTSAHRDFARQSPQQLISGEMPVFPGLGTNGLSIAASVGIPQETVRRKVCELIADRWLVRRRSKLYFTATAYQQLSPVREQIERLAVDLHRVVETLRAGASTSTPAAAPMLSSSGRASSV